MSVEDRGDAVPTVNNLANSSSSDVDNGYSPPVVKGKRTKRRRLRQFLPLPAATPSTSSSSGFSDGEDDEDMANCLILLARGQALEAEQKTDTPPAPLGGDGDGARCSRGDRDQVGSSKGERYTSRRLAEAPTMTDGKVSFYVYECKTCNKCFPTFQALGGHRSSHKKLKIAADAAASKQKNNTSMEELTLQIGIGCSYSKPTVPPNSSNNNNEFRSPALHNSKNTAVPNYNNHCSSSSSNINVRANNITKPKVHECSICGALFSSGQALGGHMRRHRADVTTTTTPALQETKDQKNALALDLNLPAPTDDDHGDPCSKPRPPLIFSPSPLVGCHY